MKNSVILLATLGCTLGLARAAHAADQVVQIPIDALLNARPVTTLTGGALVTWTKGIDGGGTGNGYETAAASAFHKDAKVNALPDDGKFAANDRHPEVVLHFSNDAPATAPQAHSVNGAGDFTFAPPVATYSKLFLFLTSAEGASSLKVTLSYGATSEVVNITLPDYFDDVKTTDAVVFYLASNMAKWSNQNNIAEMAHHNLDGIEIHPMAGQMLTSVKVEKTAPGYMVFWGATGIATSAVTGGGGSGGTSGSAGAAGMSGTAGAAASMGGASAGMSGTAGADVGGASAGGASTGGASAAGSPSVTAGSAAIAGSAPVASGDAPSDGGCMIVSAGAMRGGGIWASTLLLTLGALGRRRRQRARRGN